MEYPYEKSSSPCLELAYPHKCCLSLLFLSTATNSSGGGQECLLSAPGALSTLYCPWLLAFLCLYCSREWSDAAVLSAPEADQGSLLEERGESTLAPSWVTDWQGFPSSFSEGFTVCLLTPGVRVSGTQLESLSESHQHGGSKSLEWADSLGMAGPGMRFALSKRKQDSWGTELHTSQMKKKAEGHVRRSVRPMEMLGPGVESLKSRFGCSSKRTEAST